VRFRSKEIAPSFLKAYRNRPGRVWDYAEVSNISKIARDCESFLRSGAEGYCRKCFGQSGWCDERRMKSDYSAARPAERERTTK